MEFMRKEGMDYFYPSREFFKSDFLSILYLQLYKGIIYIEKIRCFFIY